MEERIKQKYDEKLGRFQKVLKKETPDRVPVFPYMDTWMMHYAKIPVKKAFLDGPEYLFKAIKKFTDDFYVDAMPGVVNIIPLKVLENFGDGLYVVTDEGLQIVGGKGHTMQPEEYPELIADPVRYVADKIIPRKYSRIIEDPDNTVALLSKAFKEMQEWKAYNGTVVMRMETELGIPNLFKGTCFVTPDIILDYLRDFVGITRDMRRRPKEFLEACEKLMEWTIPATIAAYPTPEDEKGVIFTPQHIPTFLKPKDFEKFYFPFMKKQVEELCVKRNYAELFYMENDWMPYLDMLQDLPDGCKLIGMMEHGDLKLIKEKIGNKMVIAGGMKANILRHGSVDDCIDMTKRCIDELAPGGGFIYAVDMILMNLEDAKPENLRAALQYMHENGVY